MQYQNMEIVGDRRLCLT